MANVTSVPMDVRVKDITNQRFGRLTVVRYAGRVAYGTAREPGRSNRAAWVCRCDCGTEKTLTGDVLRRGSTVSCGCYHLSTTTTRMTRHGKSRSREYGIWTLMRQRCKTHPRYGGRGITVCERWENSFEAFTADMGPRPSAEHSVERKDNDGPYSPENCVWATRHTQARNTRQNHQITFRGETLCITDWARRIGIHPVSLYYRITRLKWPLERALTTPSRRVSSS